jgi:hypothetical protein
MCSVARRRCRTRVLHDRRWISVRGLVSADWNVHFRQCHKPVIGAGGFAGSPACNNEGGALEAEGRASVRPRALCFRRSSDAGEDAAAEHCDVCLTWREPPAVAMRGEKPKDVRRGSPIKGRRHGKAPITEIGLMLPDQNQYGWLSISIVPANYGTSGRGSGLVKPLQFGMTTLGRLSAFRTIWCGTMPFSQKT